MPKKFFRCSLCMECMYYFANSIPIHYFCRKGLASLNDTYDERINRRRRVLVTFGGAMQAVSSYLLQRESIQQQRLFDVVADSETQRISYEVDKNPNNQSDLLSIICVNPPPRLWVSSGRPILDYCSRKRIPSLVMTTSPSLCQHCTFTVNNFQHVMDNSLVLGCLQNPMAILVVLTDGDIGSQQRCHSHRKVYYVWLSRTIAKYIQAVYQISFTKQKVSHDVQMQMLPTRSKI
jgi:hypothetical protein